MREATRNRLRIKHVNPRALKPWEENPRVNDEAVEPVARSIKRFGFNVPIVCDTELRIIAGHTRWLAAQRLQLKTVPVVRLEIENSDAIAFSIADNRLSQIAEWDHDNLRRVLEALRGEDIALSDLGFSELDLRRIFQDFREDELPESCAPEVAEMQLGDRTLLGQHTLHCANSCRQNAAVDSIEAETISLSFAGPPCFNQRGLGQWESILDYNADMMEVMKTISRSLKQGGICVWHVGNDSSNHCDLMGTHSGFLEKAGLQYLDTLIWAKSTPNYGTKRSRHIQTSRHYYPAFQWEGLLVYQKPGPMPKMAKEAADYMMDYHTNLWEIPTLTNQARTLGHPAACPVELVYRCILAYSRPGDRVLDPFGGSGTTLVAAEKAGRTSVLLEVNPAFCDAIIRRWKKLFARNE